MVVVYDGPEQDFWNKIGDIIESKLKDQERSKLIPIEKKEACRLLGISFPTLKSRMEKENMKVVYASDIDRLRQKYPKAEKA